MKKVNFILPALAFLFAIVASFATVNAKEAVLDTQKVSLPSPSSCAEIGTCTTGGATLCNNGSVNVIRFNSGGTCGTTFNGTFD